MLKALGGFREGLRVAEDWELWCRLAAQGAFVYIGGEAVLEYRLRAKSVVRSTGLEPDEALNCFPARAPVGHFVALCGGG